MTDAERIAELKEYGGEKIYYTLPETVPDPVNLFTLPEGRLTRIVLTLDWTGEDWNSKIEAIANGQFLPEQLIFVHEYPGLQELQTALSNLSAERQAEADILSTQATEIGNIETPPKIIPINPAEGTTVHELIQASVALRDRTGTGFDWGQCIIQLRSVATGNLIGGDQSNDNSSNLLWEPTVNIPENDSVDGDYQLEIRAVDNLGFITDAAFVFNYQWEA